MKTLEQPLDQYKVDFDQIKRDFEEVCKLHADEKISFLNYVTRCCQNNYAIMLMDVEDMLSILFKHRSDVVYFDNPKSTKEDPWSFYIKKKKKSEYEYEQDSRLVYFSIDLSQKIRAIYSNIVKRLNDSDVIYVGQFRPHFIEDNLDLQQCMYNIGTTCDQYKFTKLIHTIVLEQHSLKLNDNKLNYKVDGNKIDIKQYLTKYTTEEHNFQHSIQSIYLGQKIDLERFNTYT